MNYKINYSLHGVEPRGAIEEYIARKIVSIENHLRPYDKPTSEMIFDIKIEKTTWHHKTGNVYKAEIALKADGRTFHVESIKDDPHAAFEDAKDELMKELRRNKDKRMSRR